jgi:hypothetical protein
MCRQWLGNFIVRYWILLGVIGLALIAIAIPIAIVFGLPAFAQYMVDNIDIPLNVNTSLYEPTNDTITWDLFTKVKVPAAIFPKLKPMNVSFYREQTKENPIPYATVELPQLDFGPGDLLAVQGQKLRLGDITQFATFIGEAAAQDTFRIVGSGKTEACIAGLCVKTDIYKFIDFPGMSRSCHCYTTIGKAASNIPFQASTTSLTSSSTPSNSSPPMNKATTP